LHGLLFDEQSQRRIKSGVFESLVHDLRAVLRIADGRKESPDAAILESRNLQTTPESGWRGGARLKLITASSPKCPIYIISLATYGHERIAQIVIVDKTQINIFHLRRRTPNRRIRRGGDS
jgi:hypothetical protein